jgi:hypothetical protein
MAKFIEIKNLNGDIISLNVDYIFEVYDKTQFKDAPGTTIKIAVQGFNDFAYQYVETSMSYNDVMALIHS